MYQKYLAIKAKTALYFGEMRDNHKDVADVWKWVWKEIITEECKKISRSMLFFQFVSSFITVIRGWVWAFLVNALFAKNAIQATLIAFLDYLMGCIQIRVNCRQGLHREDLFGETDLVKDYRIMEMFYNHALAVHIREDTNLNEASIKRGHEQVNNLERIALFDFIDSVCNSLFPIICLFVASGYLFFTTYSLDSFFPIVINMLTIISFFTLSLYLALEAVKFGKPINEEWNAFNRRHNELMRSPERVINNAKVKDVLEDLYAWEKDIMERDKHNWKWYIEISTEYRNKVSHATTCFMVLFGIWEVSCGRMSAGLILPLIGWSRQIVDTLWRFSNMEHQINHAMPKILIMKKALELPMGITISADPVVLSPDEPIEIEFRNVSHDYTDKDGNKIPVLRNVSFSAKRGEVVAILGRSGVGKSTIYKLLYRYEDPTEGVILVNGVDLRDIDLDSLRRKLGFIAQDYEPFSGTIYDNITFGILNGCRKPTIEEAWEIAKDFKLDFGDARLTDGLLTKVGYKGTKLSGGQRQRVGIVAAVLKKPVFLVVDEATSSVDSETEKHIHEEGFAKVFAGGRGGLVTAHRLPTVRHMCNKFVYLESDEGGSRVAGIASSFEELAASTPGFSQLLATQGIVL